MSQRVIAIFASAIMLTASAASASAKPRSVHDHSARAPVCDPYSNRVVQSGQLARSCEPDADTVWDGPAPIMREENVRHNR
jgi:hypothetical protein